MREALHPGQADLRIPLVYRRLFDEHGIKPGRIKTLRDVASLPLVSREDFDPVREDAWRPFRALLRPDEGNLKRWANRAVLRRVAREKLLRGDLAAERLLAEEFKPVHLHLPAGGGPVVGYTMRDLSGLSQAGARSMAVMGATPVAMPITELYPGLDRDLDDRAPDGVRLQPVLQP